MVFLVGCWKKRRYSARRRRKSVRGGLSFFKPPVRLASVRHRQQLACSRFQWCRPLNLWHEQRKLHVHHSQRLGILNSVYAAWCLDPLLRGHKRQRCPPETVLGRIEGMEGSAMVNRYAGVCFLAGVFLSGGAAVAQNPGTQKTLDIMVQVLDGRNGKLLADQHVMVFTGPSSDAVKTHAQHTGVTTDKDGMGR